MLAPGLWLCKKPLLRSSHSFKDILGQEESHGCAFMNIKAQQNIWEEGETKEVEFPDLSLSYLNSTTDLYLLMVNFLHQHKKNWAKIIIKNVHS